MEEHRFEPPKPVQFFNILPGYVLGQPPLGTEKTRTVEPQKLASASLEDFHQMIAGLFEGQSKDDEDSSQ
jgi:hypothetical protein